MQFIYIIFILMVVMIALNLLSFLFPLILIGGLIYLALRGFGSLSGRYPGKDPEMESGTSGRYYRRKERDFQDAQYDDSGSYTRDYNGGMSSGSGYGETSRIPDEGPSSVKDEDFYRQEHEVVDVHYEEEPSDDNNN